MWVLPSITISRGTEASLARNPLYIDFLMRLFDRRSCAKQSAEQLWARDINFDVADTTRTTPLCHIIMPRKCITRQKTEASPGNQLPGVASPKALVFCYSFLLQRFGRRPYKPSPSGGLCKAPKTHRKSHAVGRLARRPTGIWGALQGTPIS